MTREKSRASFACQECGTESAKWLGRCPACGQWNTMVEARMRPPADRGQWLVSEAAPQELSTPTPAGDERIHLPFPETDRVLGGGVVKGALVLVAGDPGIGKSTLLLQLAAGLSAQGQRTFYVSGEESLRQVQSRAHRLGISGRELYFMPHTDVEAIREHLDALSPALVVVDSVQALHTDQAPGEAGTLAQVRECTRLLLQWAKAREVPVLMAGHVTKDGTVAGPRALEHMVDVVLYLETDPAGGHRILRSVKNRFGATNDIALFRMTGSGLVEVADPSSVFLSQRQSPAVGCAVVVTLEGTRPMLAEVQALTAPSAFTPPRRTGNGVDFNRLVLVGAVLSRRVGLALANQDIIVNVTGGLRIGEPAADLGIALAIASSLRDTPLDPRCVYLGEVDLTGELRPVPGVERRLAEASRLGFRRALLPLATDTPPPSGAAIEVAPVSSVREAIRSALPRHAGAGQEPANPAT